MCKITATPPNLTAAQEKLSNARAKAAAEEVASGERACKPLVGEGIGVAKTIFVMAYSHACLCALCVNVLFDLVIYGLPVGTGQGGVSGMLWLELFSWVDCA